MDDYILYMLYNRWGIFNFLIQHKQKQVCVFSYDNVSFFNVDMTKHSLESGMDKDYPGSHMLEMLSKNV
jgi:hypothetical protein